MADRMSAVVLYFFLLSSPKGTHMQLAYKTRHWADIKHLREFAGLAGSNDGALDPLYNKHCREFHAGSSCEEALKALRSKKAKQR